MKRFLTLVFVMLFAVAQATEPPPCGTVQHKIDNRTSCDYCFSISYLDCNGNPQFYGIFTAPANLSSGWTITNCQAILAVRVYDFSACGGGGIDATVSSGSPNGVVGDCIGGGSTDNVTFLGWTTRITP